MAAADDIDGCELDMATDTTSDAAAAALIAPAGWDDATEDERADAED